MSKVASNVLTSFYVSLLIVTVGGCNQLNDPKSPVETPPIISTMELGYHYTRISSPNRTVVTDLEGKWLATFTVGAQTVTLDGPVRTFSEPAYTSYTVTHSTWVRVLPKPFGGQVDQLWLAAALADNSPDVLEVSMGYINGASHKLNDAGLKLAGDADYGPLQADGTRKEGSDFNDYLGISWSYGSKIDKPELNEVNALDCSGFIRMVWGYRNNLPLTLSPNGKAIPRRSFEILDAAPGIVVIPNTGQQVRDFASLNVGDVVFFDASTDDGTRIDHVGMYIGIDSGGYHRFVSSRKTANGPTLGDYGGKSILEAINSKGLYANALRAVRRF